MIQLNGHQIAQLQDLIDREAEAEITLDIRAEAGVSDEGDEMPAGVYVWFSDYPDEGSVWLDPAPSTSSASSDREKGMSNTEKLAALSRDVGYLRGYVDDWYARLKDGKLTVDYAANIAKHLHSALDRLLLDAGLTPLPQRNASSAQGDAGWPHMDSCQLKYGGSKCTCGLSETAGQEPK